MGQRALVEQRRWFGVCRWYEGHSGWEGRRGNPCNPLIRVICDSDKRMTADWMSGGWEHADGTKDTAAVESWGHPCNLLIRFIRLFFCRPCGLRLCLFCALPSALLSLLIRLSSPNPCNPRFRQPTHALRPTLAVPLPSPVSLPLQSAFNPLIRVIRDSDNKKILVKNSE